MGEGKNGSCRLISTKFVGKNGHMGQYGEQHDKLQQVASRVNTGYQKGKKNYTY